MKISLQKGDVKAAIRNSAFNCAVALAARRAFKSQVMVSEDEISVYDRDYRVRVWTLPPDVMKWIEDFDSGKKMPLISFEVELRSALD